MSDDSINVEAWSTSASSELLAGQNADGGWSYRSGQASATEPTALALLALSGIGDQELPPESAVNWLLARRRDDGLFTASAEHHEPSWLTPIAALALRERGHTAVSQAAVQALLWLPVFTIEAPPAGTYGYDTAIAGWPWTQGDFSFTEPTCLAMIFLKRCDHFSEPRVRDGARLLRDRALPAGGWNYGEPQVLGGDLFPTVLPTALALLALADEQDETTSAGLNWLLAQRGRISSLLSLGWAATALNVLGVLDGDWRAAVIARWHELPTERRGPMETSLCLLGVTEREHHPLEVS